jgi:four helix bundle protein
VRNYRELVAWQVAFDLARRTYLLTGSFPRAEVFGLVSQMRRCAVSVASNIAEGAGRSTRKEFANFLAIARGSLNELETQFLLSRELGYCRDDTEFADVMERLFALVNGLRNSLNAERSTPNEENGQ